MSTLVLNGAVRRCFALRANLAIIFDGTTGQRTFAQLLELPSYQFGFTFHVDVRVKQTTGPPAPLSKPWVT